MFKSFLSLGFLISTYILTLITSVKSSPREEYIFKKNSEWTPSGLDIHWSKDLANWNNYFMNRDQDTFFSSGKGYSIKKFNNECSHIKNQYQWNRCSDVEVLFLMDKLSRYYNQKKFYKPVGKENFKNAYLSLEKIIKFTDKTTKTCQNIHLKDMSLDHYPKLVNECVIESLSSKLR